MFLWSSPSLLLKLPIIITITLITTCSTITCILPLSSSQSLSPVLLPSSSILSSSSSPSLSPVSLPSSTSLSFSSSSLWSQLWLAVFFFSSVYIYLMAINSGPNLYIPLTSFTDALLGNLHPKIKYVYPCTEHLGLDYEVNESETLFKLCNMLVQLHSISLDGFGCQELSTSSNATQQGTGLSIRAGSRPKLPTS